MLRRMGPSLIFDKSALQMLHMDESVWLEMFFSNNVVPLFYVETLADLEKEVGEGRSAEGLVGMLAAKTPSNAVPNVHHHKIILLEMAGGDVEMNGKPLIDGEYRRTPDGKLGFHVEESSESQALHRWRAHDFLGIERAAARTWREQLKQQNYDLLVSILENILPPDRRIPNLGELKRFLDEFCRSTDPNVLTLACQILSVPDPYVACCVERWESQGRPSLDQFLPYSSHVLRVELLYYLGVSRGLISGERSTNKVDLAYLFYLPFTNVFTSNDGLHHRTVPHFLRSDQVYLKADDLKRGLREIDGHFEQLPPEVKERGALVFAQSPPPDLENPITEAWDQYGRSDWRELARAREETLADPLPESDVTVEELNEMLRTASPVPDGVVVSSVESADYMIVTRRVPPTKGRWRMVSSEAEESGREAADGKD